MTPKFAISTLSLVGTCVHHQLPTKILTAASLGYEVIEIFIPDFEAFVDEVRTKRLHHDLFAHSPAEDSLEIDCAKVIANLCKSVDIAIPVLQPLRGFENFASSSAIGGGGLPAALKEGERWLRLMPHLHTTLLLVRSTDIEPQLPAYFQVEAFRALGQIAARYGVRVGYEPFAWGLSSTTGSKCVVHRVGTENVGIIFDSFNCL
ncbi:xylose isomerase-like protein [Mycena galericulata]|nr:xylose isomerase-like protein [Mycena galericulata]